MHTKFKFVTLNSNSLHQIQIDHTEIKFVTRNSNSSHRIPIRHTKFNFITRNSNSSNQIQIMTRNSKSSYLQQKCYNHCHFLLHITYHSITVVIHWPGAHCPTLLGLPCFSYFHLYIVSMRTQSVKKREPYMGSVKKTHQV